MIRPVSIVILVLCALATPVAGTAQTGPTAEREFPSIDLTAFSRLENDLQARRAEAAPFTLEAVEWFLASGQSDRAVSSLRQVMETGAIDDAVSGLWTLLREGGSILFNEARREAPGVPAVAAAARARLEALGREDAARLEAVLVRIEAAMVPVGIASGIARTADVIRKYPGTEAALDEGLLNAGRQSSIQDRVAARAAFGARHPGTILEAHAQYVNAFDLAHNGQVAGVDPTSRLLEVVAIRDDLLSGRYPPCEWVDRAPELVTQFSMGLRPQFGPAGADRMLAAYRDHLELLIERAGDDLSGTDIAAFFLWSRMGELYERQGNKLAGIEAAFSDLEARVRNPRVLRLFRAELFVANSFFGADRDEMVARAHSALEALVAEDDGYPSRKALAVLASLELREGSYDQAINLYERYIVRYPDSPWTWTARLRLGQAHEALGHLEAAVHAYQETATGAAGQPTARILGESFAAWTLESMGRFGDALSSFRRAREAWNIELGFPIFELRLTQPPGTSLPRLVSRPRIQHTLLDERIATLTRTPGLEGGAALEQARLLIKEGSYVAALEPLDGLLARAPEADAAREADSLRREARFKRALELASTGHADRDPTAAAELLDELVAEPFTFTVTAARMARSALLLTLGQTALASAEVASALEELLVYQQSREPPEGVSPIDADVIAIRQLLFTPRGGGLLDTRGWSSFTFPADAPDFLITHAEVVVRRPGAESETRPFVHSYPGLDQVLALTQAELSTLESILLVVGGNRQGIPTGVMSVPNQPIGDSAAIAALWNQCFPVQPWHWGGWTLLTHPIIGAIEFLDVERTRAIASVTLGYSGATVVLERVDGVWHALRLTNQWVT